MYVWLIRYHTFRENVNLSRHVFRLSRTRVETWTVLPDNTYRAVSGVAMFLPTLPTQINNRVPTSGMAANKTTTSRQEQKTPTPTVWKGTWTYSTASPVVTTSIIQALAAECNVNTATVMYHAIRRIYVRVLQWWLNTKPYQMAQERARDGLWPDLSVKQTLLWTSERPGGKSNRTNSSSAGIDR